MSDKPLWQIREELRRVAQEHVSFRARFEELMGRKSRNPIPNVVVPSDDLLRLLDEYDRLKARDIAEKVVRGPDYNTEVWG